MLSTVAVLVVVVWLGTVAYWQRERRARLAAAMALLLLMAGAGFSIWAVWMERPEHEIRRNGDPVAIAIAFDASPSMLARPAPTAGHEIPARFERARSVLQNVIDGLETSNRHYLVSITGFAGDAGVLIGWHDDLAEVREALAYTVTPELFGDNGTNLDKAAGSLAALFDMLPPRFENARRIVLFVSDGENTARSSDLQYAVQRLEATGADIVALYVGMAERNEGIPVYNEFGEFRGFRVLSGERFTRPDQDAMRSIADVREGLFVRAEDPDAAARILEQATPGNDAITVDSELFPLFGLFALTTLTMALILR